MRQKGGGGGKKGENCKIVGGNRTANEKGGEPAHIPVGKGGKQPKDITKALNLEKVREN